jgi:hypothetical protein
MTTRAWLLEGFFGPAVTVSVQTDDPGVVRAVEEAAARHGLNLRRVDDLGAPLSRCRLEACTEAGVMRVRLPGHDEDFPVCDWHARWLASEKFDAFYRVELVIRPSEIVTRLPR